MSHSNHNLEQDCRVGHVYSNINEAEKLMRVKKQSLVVVLSLSGFIPAVPVYLLTHKGNVILVIHDIHDIIVMDAN